MPSSVILLVLVSAFMHASWNLMSRFEDSQRDFNHKLLLTLFVVLFLPAAVMEYRQPVMTPLAWWCVLGSGVSASVYMFFLARAYESSDFTIVYPVARALPVVFVALADVLRGRLLTPAGWVGVWMVAVGVIFVPLRSFKDIKLENYFNLATLWMVLTALGTVGYTLLDKVAAEVIRPGADTAARYGAFYFAVSYFPYLLLLTFFRKKGEVLAPARWRLAVPAALLSFLAYWLILWAYQLSPYAGYIVAFRQFSIVIGAVAAFRIFKESGVAVRLAGAGLISTGLVLIAAWG
jgi:drug/metabolite transporter (DMT)-like permease